MARAVVGILTFFGIAVTVICGCVVIFGLPAVVLAAVIGVFFFIGTPVYAILRFIEKGAVKLKTKYHESREERVFARYAADEQKELAGYLG